jgi:predicted dinucleotide-binding enzyme
VKSSARIAILGTGRLASALASRLSAAGWHVAVGSSSTERASILAQSVGARGGGGLYEAASAEADIVLLACLWEQVESIVTRLNLNPRTIVMDATNPESPAGRGLVVGFSTSGAEQIAARVPGQVVKAFNSVYAEVIRDGLHSPLRPTGLYCGGDSRARQVTEELISDCGLQPLYAGPLETARYLEPLAALIVELVRGTGLAAESTAFVVARADHALTAT